MTKVVHAAVLVVALLPSSIPRLTAADLKKETVGEFERYVAAEERINWRHDVEHFLWSDELPPTQRASLLHGEILMQGARNKGTTEIKNGLIHDWWGAVFIPAATLSKAIDVVQDYQRHNIIYKPEVAAARILSRQGSDFKVYLRIVKVKFLISAVLNSEHEIHFVQLDPRHINSRSSSTRISEAAIQASPTNMNCRPARIAVCSGA